jgi:hypothetical protein
MIFFSDHLVTIIKKQSVGRGILNELLTDVSDIKKKLVSIPGSTVLIDEVESIFKRLKLPIMSADDVTILNFI